jgi:hypothetical protein
VEGLEHRLIALGLAGETVTYGALSRAFGLRMAVLTAALEDLMETDVAAGRAIRASVCVGRLNGDMPAEGFFLKALELGLDVSDRRAFVMSQRLALQRANG